MRYSYLFAAALGLAFLTPSWGQTPPRRTAAAARPTPRSSAPAIPPTRVVAPVTADEDPLVEEEEVTEEVVLAPPVRRSKPTVRQTSTAQAEMQPQVAPRAATTVQTTQAESVLSESDGMEYEDEGYEVVTEVTTDSPTAASSARALVAIVAAAVPGSAISITCNGTPRG